MGTRARMVVVASMAVGLLVGNEARAQNGQMEAPPENTFGEVETFGILAGLAGLVALNTAAFTAEMRVRRSEDGSLAPGWLATEYLAAVVHLGLGIGILVHTASNDADLDVKLGLASASLTVGGVWTGFAVHRTVKNRQRRLRHRVGPAVALRPLAGVGPRGGAYAGLAASF